MNPAQVELRCHVFRRDELQQVIKHRLSFYPLEFEIMVVVGVLQPGCRYLPAGGLQNLRERADILHRRLIRERGIGGDEIRQSELFGIVDFFCQVS
ncbi:hypothetical protein D3C75_1212380 [compost metagenome]